MAVMITDLCINCDACVDECPVSAIVSEGDSPRDDWEYTYVKPEKCIEYPIVKNKLTLHQ